MPMASKNSAISFASGAPPEIGIRSRPPSRSLHLAEDEPVGERCRLASPRGTGSSRASSRLTSRPIGSAQSMSRRLTPVASSKRDWTAEYTFSYTRGTLGSTVGRTWSIASPTRSGSARNAIGKPTYAPVSSISRPKLCASGRYRSITSSAR